MSKRDPKFTAHHPGGYTEHISEAEAHQRVADGEAAWSGQNSIKMCAAYQPDPGKPQSSTHSQLSREVGPYLARAYCRDRNKCGWAYAAVQQMRNARETPSYQQAEVLQLV